MEYFGFTGRSTVALLKCHVTGVGNGIEELKRIAELGKTPKSSDNISSKMSENFFFETVALWSVKPNFPRIATDLRLPLREREITHTEC